MTKHSEHSEKSGEKEGSKGMDSFKKWLGMGAAVLSFGSAIYGVVHEQADKAARQSEVTQLMESGRLQEKAGDYNHAWDSFKKAETTAAADGVLARFIGTLGKQQKQAHDALQSLAERLVRDAHSQKGEEGLGELGDNAIKVLSADVGSATGAAKADMLAHIGYAYFLKGRYDEDAAKRARSFYEQAVGVDPANPFAHAFWGHLILWNNGSIAEAREHFAKALSSGREHEVVRHYELAAFSNGHSDEMEAAWWQVVAEMHKAGEPLDERTTRNMASLYYSASSNDNQRQLLFAAVPAAQHAEMARYLLTSKKAGDQILPVKVVLAESLEAEGRLEEALSAWQDVQAAVQGDATIYNTRANDAVKRLGGRKPH